MCMLGFVKVPVFILTLILVIIISEKYLSSCNNILKAVRSAAKDMSSCYSNVHTQHRNSDIFINLCN